MSGISLPAGNIQFTVAGVPGWNYTVQSSTNLVDWVSLVTNASPFVFSGTNIFQFRQQYFRSVFSP